jgi:DNA-nicking Smr family endonuclease
MSPDDLENLIILPIEDSLDLHTFQPREVKELLDDYLEAALQKGFREVLIIHGKGQGVLRQRVHALLKRHPLVISMRQADEAAGGWGATVAVLKEARTEEKRTD